MKPHELEQYREQGYVLLRGLVEPRSLARYERRFVELASGSAELPPGMNVMRDVEVVKGVVEPETPLHAVNKLLGFEHDATLYEYALEPGLVSAVRELIGPDLVSIATNVFNKPPGVDGRHPLHQDLLYFSLRPPDRIVGAWTALSRTTRENGCLAVLPGSHRGQLLEHANPGWEHVNFAFFGIDDVDSSGVEHRVHVEMEPGDTLLFHPLLVHGSGHNRTRDFRRAISVHYAAADCVRPGETRRGEPPIRPIPSA